MIRAALAALFVTGVALPAAAQETAAPAPASAVEESSGQDPTRPVTRVDVRVKYQDDPGGFDHQIATLRADKPFDLKDGWKLNTRVDLPFVRTNTITPFENSDGGYEAGLSDILVQALLVTPPKGRWAFAFGTQLIAPSGSDDQFTSGKWQLVPTVAAVYQLPNLSPGSFVGVLVRDAISFAGRDDREKINVVTVQPLFNWQLPDRWFVTFAPEVKFDTRDDWKLFLPFDVTVGRKINARTVVSLQADLPLVDQYEQYDWQAEFRIGFFF